MYERRRVTAGNQQTSYRRQLMSFQFGLTWINVGMLTVKMLSQHCHKNQTVFFYQTQLIQFIVLVQPNMLRAMFPRTSELGQPVSQ